MENCKKCGNEFEPTKGLISYCSLKCRNSRIQTDVDKLKKSIAAKNSIKVQNQAKKVKTRIIKKCECGNEFEVIHSAINNRKFCSNICSIKSRSNDEAYRKNLSLKRIEAIQNGKTNFNSIKCKYKFKDKVIKCDSKIEYSCLDYFEKKYSVIDINRNTDILEYVFEGKVHRFLPDFKITTSIGTFIVEAKSAIVTNRLNIKWRFYKETSEIKKIALEKYCNENNLLYFWYTKDLHRKFYNSLRL